MSELMLTFGPLLALMLTPLLIPLLAVAVAGVGDLVLPRRGGRARGAVPQSSRRHAAPR